jgi:hypothetical protein
MFYAKSTGGFYDESIHGSRKLTIIAPDWVRPMIDVPDPDWIAADHPEGTPVPMVQVPDPNAIPATIEIDNPASKIPADAVEITADQHAALIEGQSQGRRIVTDAEDRPVLSALPTLEELLAAARTIKKADISRACSVAISAGIASSALDALHTYPTTFVDQHNIIALVLDAQVVGPTYQAKFWCADAAGVWARRLHTADQLIQLGQEMAVHVQTQQDHYELLLDQIAAAQTAEEIEAVTW